MGLLYHYISLSIGIPEPQLRDVEFATILRFFRMRTYFISITIDEAPIDLENTKQIQFKILNL